MNDYKLPYGMPRAGSPGVIPEKGNYRPGYGDRPLDPVPPHHVAEGYVFRPQVFIENNAMNEDTDSSAQTVGEITAQSARNVTMISRDFNVNGIVAAGNSRYTISDSTFDFTGDGINDFQGWGAQVMAQDTAKVVIENTKMTTTGVIRPCTVAVDTSTLIVKNCELTGNGGTITENTAQPVNGGMIVPPPGLGIGGNSRTHLSTGNSHCYFYDSRITANGWAALSCDAGYGDLYIEANRCEIINSDTGYATFSDGGCLVVVNDSKVKALTHAMILAGRAKQRIFRSVVESEQLAISAMTIFGHFSEMCEISVQDSCIRSGKDAMLFMSTNAYVDLRNSKIESGNGVIVHTIVNPDPCATKCSPEDQAYGVKVVMCDMDITGDFIHEDSARTMALAINHTTINGKIQNAAIQLDEASRWVATQDSRVMIYGNLGSIDALPGVTITALSDVMEPQTVELPSGGRMVIEDQMESIPMPEIVGFDDAVLFAFE